MDALEQRTVQAILIEYQSGIRGHGYKAVGKRLHLPSQTAQEVVARVKKRNGNTNPAPRGHNAGN